MNENLWKKKKEAFLVVLRHVLQGEKIPNDFKEIIEFSFGAGIPPFGKIEKCSEIKHPVSGNSKKLTTEIDRHKIIQEAERLAKSRKDEKGCFLSLWRLLPEKVPEILKIPAHFGQPVYDLFTAASLASGVVAAWSDPAFVIFTIAGVQDFITTSRRTQDLWMGSFLLSWLSYQGMKTIAEKYGPDVIIMPQLWNQPLFDYDLAEKIKIGQPDREKLRIANLPNIFSFFAPRNGIETLIKEIENNLKTSINLIFSSVKERLTAGENKKFENWENIWKRHEDSFLKELGIYWAAVTFPKSSYLKDWLEKVWDFIEKDDEEGDQKVIEKLVENLEGNHSVGAVYPVVRTRTTCLLGSAKLYRVFSLEKEYGERCSLCGKRAALGSEIIENKQPKILPYKKVKKIFEKLQKSRVSFTEGELKLAGRIRKGEILCGTCLVRRLALECFFEKEYKIDHHLFPSTSDLATASFKAAILNNWDKLKIIKEFLESAYQIVEATGVKSSSVPSLWKLVGEDKKEKAKLLRLDGEWLFEESYEPARIERIYGIDKKKLSKIPIHDAQKTLKKLLDKISELKKENKWEGVERPARYYALIAADGDKMGDLLSGKSKKDAIRWTCLFVDEKLLPENLIRFRRPITPHFHRSIANLLREFAIERVQQIVENEALGRLVYAGGDDVFALSCVDDFPKIVRGLHKAYSEVFDNSATISIAVVIAHHKSPFYLVVEEAYSLLKKFAKEKLGRNAWAVEIMRRSGEITLFGAGFVENERDVLYYFDKILSYLRKGLVSPRILSHIERLSNGLMGLDEDAIEKVVSYYVNRALITNNENKNEIINDFVGLFRTIKEMVKDRKKEEKLSEKEDTYWEQISPVECFLECLKGACFVARRAE